MELMKTMGPGDVLGMSAERVWSMVSSESRRCDIEETHCPAVEL